MNKKNIMLFIAFFLFMQTVHAATFTIHNLSGRDILVKPFWLSTTAHSYTFLPAGKSFSYNSNLHSVEKIEWITDKPDHDTWVGYMAYDNRGRMLDGHQVLKQFRIYADGQYEDNFSGTAHTNQIPAFDTRALIFMDSTQVNLASAQNPYLVVENRTQNRVLVRPPVTKLVTPRGFVVADYDCIEPGGSKIYYLGTPPTPGTSGFSRSYGTQEIEYIKQNSSNGRWYNCAHSLAVSGASYAAPGKIQILPTDDILYKISQSGALYTLKPMRCLEIGPPGQCQLSK